MANGFDVLQERGLVYTVSDEAGLRQALDGEVTVYCGFDPTDSSLTHGNLVPIMMLAHLQRAGAKVIALVGGGTGMIGDPSDKTSARPMMTIEQIDANVASQQAQLARYIDFSVGRARMVNNAEWLRSLGYIDFLRDIGRYFSINQMLGLEFVRSRLEKEQGLTYLEFSYLLLQSYDYLELYRRYGCTLQVGGQDQWANILGGADLIRRVEGGKAYALVAPLITDSAGRKVSKSDGTAIYLDPNRTSPYQFYQYWVNCADVDVEKYLKIYTFMPLDEIRRLAALAGADIRHAKDVLAHEVTRLAHGQAAADEARETSRALFSGAAGPLDAMPTTTVPAADLVAGILLPDLLVQTGLFASKREARPRITQGGVSLNDEVVKDERLLVGESHLRDGGILLRTGKRFHRVVVG